MTSSRLPWFLIGLATGTGVGLVTTAAVLGDAAEDALWDAASKLVEVTRVSDPRPPTGSGREAMDAVIDRVSGELSKARRATETDFLTGARSRVAILGLTYEALENAYRSREPVAIALLDIDFFKRVNDSFGHAIGDGVLRALAQRLSQALLPHEVLGRYGGEEFIILFPIGTTSRDAVMRAEVLRSRVEGQSLRADEGPDITVTISVGVAASSKGTLSVNGLVRNADTALYAAKAAGRNRVLRFTGPLGSFG